MTIGMQREGPWRVFVSHTSELRDHPQDRSFVAAAEGAIIRAGHAISNMAYFSARDAAPADYCTAEVAHANIFVAIVGHRYGATVSGQPDLSYTELEFDAATTANLPRLVFLVRPDAAGLPPAEQPLAQTAKQTMFRQRLQQAGLTVAWVSSPGELELCLYQGLMEVRAQAMASRPLPPLELTPGAPSIVPTLPDLQESEGRPADMTRWMFEHPRADIGWWARWMFDAACKKVGRPNVAMAQAINRRLDGRTVSADFIEACRRGAASPPLEVGLAALVEAGADVASLARTLTSDRADVTMDVVKRRQFLKAMTSVVGVAASEATMLGAPDSDIFERLSRALAGPGHVDTTTMDYLEQRFAGYWHDYHVTKLPARDLVPYAVDDLSRVTGLLEKSLAPSTRVRLGAIAGRGALVVGAFLWDTRSYTRSRDLLRAAITAGREINDNTIEAVAWAWSSFGWTYDTSMADRGRRALQCAQAGQQLCRPNSAVGSWLACVEAEVHANLGDQSACKDTLHGAMRASNLSANGGDWEWSRFDEAGRAGFRGVCMLRLGHYEEARSALQEGLVLLDPSERQRRLTLMIDIAQTYAKAGAVEEACSKAGEAMRMAVDLKSPVKAQRLRQLRDDLAVRGDVACIRHFDEQWMRGLDPPDNARPE